MAPNKSVDSGFTDPTEEPASKSNRLFAPDDTWAFKHIGGVSLRLFVFHPRSERESPAAAIIFFHGGGWQGGSPEKFFPQCRYLADRGMWAFSVEYRTRASHNASPQECVKDGKSALRWVRARAGQLRLDPRRIAAAGGSAGGHIAAACAALEGFEEPGEDLCISPRPDALVLFNPVIDNGPQGFGHEMVREYWCAFSPLHNIRPGMPPAIVFLGEADHLIPVETAREFKKRMMAVSARCEVWTYPGQPHGFYNYRDGTNPFYDDTLHKMDVFLYETGFLTSPPAISVSGASLARYLE